MRLLVRDGTEKKRRRGSQHVTLDAECRKPINVLREAKDTLNKPQPTLDSYTDRRGRRVRLDKDKCTQAERGGGRYHYQYQSIILLFLLYEH